MKRKAVFMGRRLLKGGVLGYAFMIEGAEVEGAPAPCFFKKRMGHPAIGSTIEVEEVKPGSYKFENYLPNEPKPDTTTVNEWCVADAVSKQHHSDARLEVQMSKEKSRFEAAIQPLAILFKSCKWNMQADFMRAVEVELRNQVRRLEAKERSK